MMIRAPSKRRAFFLYPDYWKGSENVGHEFKRLRFKMDGYNEEGIFSGYAAVFENIDSGGDVIEPGAFTKTLAEGWGRVKILALHNDCWLPIGRPLELKEDANGLFISAKVSDTTRSSMTTMMPASGICAR